MNFDREIDFVMDQSDRLLEEYRNIEHCCLVERSLIVLMMFDGCFDNELMLKISNCNRDLVCNRRTR